MSKSKIPQAVADKIVRALSGRYGLLVTHKTGPLWTTVKVLLNGARALGYKGLPSGDEFTHDFGTTFGTIVVLPDAELSPDDLVCLLAHEAGHAEQFVADPGGFVVRYLTIPEARGSHYEVPQYAVSYALHWALTGEIPSSPRDLPAALQWGYALGEADVAHCAVALEQHITSIVAGIMPEGACRVVLSILAADAPEALDPGALALIRANNPEALAPS